MLASDPGPSGCLPRQRMLGQEKKGWGANLAQEVFQGLRASGGMDRTFPEGGEAGGGLGQKGSGELGSGFVEWEVPVGLPCL